MSKIILIFIFIPITIFAQDEYKSMLDSVYDFKYNSPNDSFILSKTYYDYDPAGNTRSIIYINSLGIETAAMSDSYKNKLTYDIVYKDLALISPF